MPRQVCANLKHRDFEEKRRLGEVPGLMDLLKIIRFAGEAVVNTWPRPTSWRTKHT
jgi:hypothetical protein